MRRRQDGDPETTRDEIESIGKSDDEPFATFNDFIYSAAYRKCKHSFTHFQELPRDPSVEESVHNELEAQERLGCKSFDWYLNHIIPELQVPPETAQYYGNVSYSILMGQT